MGDRSEALADHIAQLEAEIVALREEVEKGRQDYIELNRYHADGLEGIEAEHQRCHNQLRWWREVFLCRLSADSVLIREGEALYGRRFKLVEVYSA